jgi:hypothetical protein
MRAQKEWKVETHPARLRPHEECYPVLHLPRGLVGEGYRQDLLRRRQSLLEEVGDPVRKHAGLPAPGPGQNEERTLCVLYGV